MIQEYQTQNELNPKLWDGDHLQPGLRLKLLKIAQYFYEFLGIDAPIKGVILTGSNVNYNWTDTSDIDLHVLINYKDVNDSIPFVREYMMAKKSIWNNTYPLQYKGMPIELYAQDENEPHASTGVYCLTCDKWLKQPSPEQISIDDAEIDRKADPYKFEIDNLQADDPQLEMKIKSLKKRLKRMRQTGLDASGEYSIENLAFKSLRNSGHLAKLNDLQQGNVMNLLALEYSADESYVDNIESKKVNEVGESSAQPYIYKLKAETYYKIEYTFTTDSGLDYIVKFELDDDIADVVFSTQQSLDIARSGGKNIFIQTFNNGELFKIMATVTSIIKEFLETYTNIERLVVSPTKEYDSDDRRFKLYTTFIKKNIDSKKYSYDSDKNEITITRNPVNDDRYHKHKLVNELNLFLEKNVPNDPSKWSYAKSQAKKKFDVYPSAYANAWASKKYKELGGTWRKLKK